MRGKQIIPKVLMVILAVVLIAGCGKKSFIVTFDSANSTKTEQTVEKGKQASKPTNPTKDGYKFIGWFLDNTEFDFSKSIDKNITLVAKWEKVETTKYTVTFNSNGGSSVSSITINENEKVTLPTNPTRDGYTFSYWEYQNKEFSFDTSIKENITLIAIWTKKDSPVVKPDPKPEIPQVKKYTVKFDTTGGSSISSQTIESGKLVSKPTNPTRNGYKFITWTLNGTNYDFSNKVTGNITLIAKWEEVITYTYKIELINGDNLSTDRLVKVYRNGVDVTSSVSMILGNDGSPLGKYNTKLGGIKIVLQEFSNYSSYKAQINGTTYNLES